MSTKNEYDNVQEALSNSQKLEELRILSKEKWISDMLIQWNNNQQLKEITDKHKLGEFQKCYVEWRKSYTEEHKLCISFYMKF